MMIDELIKEIGSVSTSLDDVTNDIEMPEMVDISLPDKKDKDLFAEKKHASWDKSVEARCDFSYELRLTRRASICFISIWKKTIFGKTLTEIKSDDNEIDHFAEGITKLIKEIIGEHISLGDWALVTTPMRRHKTHNFASLITEQVADNLRVPFYFDCAHCHSRHRVGAVFSANNIPKERNVIVIDDFVTTGSTLKSMYELLKQYDKNIMFFAGINNKL